MARFDIIVIRTFCFVTELLLNCTEIKIKGMTEILSVPSHNQPQPFTLKLKTNTGKWNCVSFKERMDPQEDSMKMLCLSLGSGNRLGRGCRESLCENDGGKVASGMRRNE